MGQKSGSQSARIAKLWQFLQGHPKPAFSEKVQKGDQGKFFKNRSKRCPRLKGRKALWRKWHYPLNSMSLKSKDWKRFRRKQRLQRCPNGQVMAIFGRSPKTRMFGKKQRGDQEKLLKNRPKSTPRFKGPRALWRKCHYPLICILLYCKDWRRFWHTKRLQKCQNCQVMANLCEVIQNPHFLKKCKGGTKGNFSKIAKKVAPV